MRGGRSSPKVRVAILGNIIAPYRIPVYQGIGDVFETRIFLSGEEDNRTVWQGVAQKLERVAVEKAWGFTLRFPYRKHGKAFDSKYFHVTPGFFGALVKFGPDAIISNEMGFRTLIALLYGSLRRKPVWVWWGGTLHTEKDIGLLRRVVRKLVTGWTKQWISYGNTSTEYLVSLGVDRTNILQIQNCVDERLYAAEVEPAVRCEPKPVFLYVGQLIRRKGVDLLLRAAANLQQQGYQFSLLMVGGGPEKDALEHLAGQLGLRDVSFLPAQKPDRMPAVYRSADYLIFPTLEDVWGLVVNEALWSGIPVLSSVFAGCAHELLPRENVFNPLDQEQFVVTWKLALDGRLAQVDQTVLMTCDQVAAMITCDIDKVLGRIGTPSGGYKP